MNKQVDRERYTFGGNFAVDKDGGGGGGAGGQGAGGEEGNKRVPGDGGGDEVSASTDEVAVELEGIRVESECPGYRPQVQFLIISRDQLDCL